MQFRTVLVVDLSLVHEECNFTVTVITFFPSEIFRGAGQTSGLSNVTETEESLHSNIRFFDLTLSTLLYKWF